MKRAVLATLLIATGARADTVWDRALETGAPSVDRDLYEKEMSDGDDFVRLANSHGTSLANVKHSFELAIVSYRNAAKAMPKAAEPYYRIGKLIQEFYFDCQPDPLNMPPPTCDRNEVHLNELKMARRLVEAWDAFEARAPLDPRVTELLESRAIARTKLVTEEPKKATQYLNGALADYEAALARWKDGLYANRYSKKLLYGNLAETYMMVGRLDDAIDAYKEAWAAGGNISVVYGMA